MKGLEVHKLGRSGVERLDQGLNIVSLDVVEASILEVHHEALVAHNLKSNLLQGGVPAAPKGGITMIVNKTIVFVRFMTWCEALSSKVWCRLQRRF